MSSLTKLQVPVIDLTREVLKPGTGLWLSKCKEICNALEEFGCFIASYQEMSPELENAIFNASKELFDLPPEVKREFFGTNPFSNYFEQNPNAPPYEVTRIANATVSGEVLKFTKVLWPAGNNNFCGTAYSYAKVKAQLQQMVVRMIFDHYGLGKYYESNIESTSYALRFMKYRPRQAQESEIACPCHTDKTFITTLHQNDVNGLEIQTKNGDWICLKLIAPSSFVVMAGEVCMAWSNDRIYSCAHRVTMTGNEDRFTIGLFSMLKGTIKVPEELVDEQHPLKYKPFDNLGLINCFASDKGCKLHTIKAYCGL